MLLGISTPSTLTVTVPLQDESLIFDDTGVCKDEDMVCALQARSLVEGAMQRASSFLAKTSAAKRRLPLTSYRRHRYIISSPQTKKN